jgi:hypothetical protein
MVGLSSGVGGGFFHRLRMKDDVHCLHTMVVIGVKGWLMLGAGGGQECSITNTGVADGERRQVLLNEVSAGGHYCQGKKVRLV